MATSTNKRYDQTYKYNRQTKAFRRTQAKAKMKELDVKSPKQKHIKLILRGSIVLFILWVPFAVFCIHKLGVPGLLLAFAIAVAYVAGLAVYFSRYQRKLIYAYIDLGIPKEVYMNEMKKRKKDEKSLRKLEAAWDAASKAYKEKSD